MTIVTRHRIACLITFVLVSLPSSPVEAQWVRAVVSSPRRVADARSALNAQQELVSQNRSSNATAKGTVIGLLVGALAGAAVGAMIEAGNEGGSAEIRKRYRGFGYAVFIPTGAVVGAVVGAIIGARTD